jgi:hypothetical protein
LKEYEAVQPKVLMIARPQLEAQWKRAGERDTFTSSVTESPRTGRFDFRSINA